MIADLLPKLQPYLPDNIYQQLPAVLTFGIDGPLRLSNFLGQCHVETGGWKHFTENLNYSAERLMAVFPKYFKDLTTANQYARNPEKIANKVYADRMGNGDELSGDGYRHRGMGCIQLTGADNQKAFFRAVGLPEDTNPELIATLYSLQSAAWFFREHNLWVICDHGIDDTTVTTLTHKINGGENGLSDRINYTEFYHNIII